MAPALRFSPAVSKDFDRLLALRLAAMRPSLEAIGRFDVERSTARFRASFHAAATTLLHENETLVGFFALRREPDHLHLDHLYVAPAAQSRGIGGAAMQRVINAADALRLPLRLGALRASRANAFYVRHGFRLTHEDDWDLHYERQPSAH